MSPRPYIISARDEELACAHCGTPLRVGDEAIEVGEDTYCSRQCAGLPVVVVRDEDEID